MVPELSFNLQVQMTLRSYNQKSPFFCQNVPNPKIFLSKEDNHTDLFAPNVTH